MCYVSGHYKKNLIMICTDSKSFQPFPCPWKHISKPFSAHINWFYHQGKIGVWVLFEVALPCNGGLHQVVPSLNTATQGEFTSGSNCIAASVWGRNIKPHAKRLRLFTVGWNSHYSSRSSNTHKNRFTVKAHFIQQQKDRALAANLPSLPKRQETISTPETGFSP